jgi:hypothetical protein
MGVKFLTLTGCLLLSMQAAIAAGPGDCTKISNTSDRLACFDKLFPPERKVADPKRELRDITVDENVRIEKSLKSICRDCSR